MSEQKKQIAILQFPGLNSEYETVRAVNDAGMNGVIFRWNEDSEKLKNFDGYIIPGGFSYEDRGRAGLIASMDPVMNVLRAEVGKGKPLLGICNGAQIVIETGLVPGDGKLSMCLANNKRVDSDGRIIGTGFINYDQTVKCVASEARSAFNIGIAPYSQEKKIFSAPIAHGEGRFTTVDDSVISELEKNDQIVFQYCDKNGMTGDFYPLNPNGALKSSAGICNRAGNVMAIMPHPERGVSAPIPEIFNSMRVYLEEFMPNGKAMIPHPEEISVEKSLVKYDDLPLYETLPNSIEIFSSLIITDNTAQTFTNTLAHLGFDIKIHRSVHYKLEGKLQVDKLWDVARYLIETGILLNVNKELAIVKIGDEKRKYSASERQCVPMEKCESHGAAFLVTDREDFAGASKLNKLEKYEGKFTFLTTESTLTESIHYFLYTDGNADINNIDEIISTNIFANPHSQILKKYSL